MPSSALHWITSTLNCHMSLMQPVITKHQLQFPTIELLSCNKHQRDRVEIWVECLFRMLMEVNMGGHMRRIQLLWGRLVRQWREDWDKSWKNTLYERTAQGRSTNCMLRPLSNHRTGLCNYTMMTNDNLLLPGNMCRHICSLMVPKCWFLS